MTAAANASEPVSVSLSPFVEETLAAIAASDNVNDLSPAPDSSMVQSSPATSVPLRVMTAAVNASGPVSVSLSPLVEETLAVTAAADSASLIDNSVPSTTTE